MEVEAEVVKRLEELRRWHMEKQENLLKKQEEERERLSNEQYKRYQALSLSVQNASSSEEALQILDISKNDAVHSPNLSLNESEMSKHEDISVNDSFASNKCDISSNHSIIDVKDNDNSIVQLSVPLLSLKTANGRQSFDSDRNNNSDKHERVPEDGWRSPMSGRDPISVNPALKSLAIDDLPVPSPKKDFQTLLEERLRESEVMNDSVNESNKVIKYPFLKKGEGLARFNPGTNKVTKQSTMRPRSASLMANTSKNAKRTPIASREGARTTPRSANSKPMVAQRQLSLKNVPPPKKPRSKSLSLCPAAAAAVRPKTVNKQLNDSITSDAETKTKKELEEMRIFEMMEEKAENSSFCSTSSTVMAFLQQSTPLKLKKANQAEEVQVNGNVKDLEAVPKNSGKTIPLRRKTFSKNSQLPKWQSLIPPVIEPQPQSKQHNFQNKFVASLDRAGGKNLANAKMNDEKEDTNASLHVRFAEFNEYKTMTDTSSVSSVEPSVIKGIREDEGAWSDCTSESSDKENKHESEESFLTNPEESMSDTALLNEMMLEAKSQLVSALNRKESNIKPYVDTPQRFDGKRLQLPSRLVKERLTPDQNCEDDEMDFTTDSTDEADYTEEKETTIIDMDSDEPKEKRAESPVNGKLAASSVESINGNGTVFKSDLLKSRLLELEKEIDIFRRENAALAIQRQSLEEEKKKLQKEFKEKEKSLEEKNKRLESSLQEEKKRIVREKAALESRLRDAREKAQKSEQERKDIQQLKEQLSELQDEVVQKESRWQAAQARQKSQVRILQTENAKLKAELEKLKAAKKSTLKSGRIPTYSTTRAIHRINNELDNHKKKLPAKVDYTSSEDDTVSSKRSSGCKKMAVANCEDGSKVIVYETSEKPQKTMEDVTRKRNMYNNLLKEAIIGLDENRDATARAIEEVEMHRNSLGPEFRVQEVVLQDSEDPGEIESDNNQVAEKSPHDHATLQTVEEKTEETVKQSTTMSKQGIREVCHPDGRIEYWYPNGNVRKIYPDRSLNKMIYYNGDVKEEDGEGKIRYFYASTKTWHTTMPDGLEILEFHDGQVEKREKDGTVEIAFPDGSIRIILPNGSEKWLSPDGTIAETFANGEKILCLPNGQREIHTKDHKRREYPDGTVKLLYTDGTQETRYANGRVRLKDKDGNLIMDSRC